MNFKHLLSFLLIASSIFCAQTCKNTVEPPLPPQKIDTTSHNFTILRIDTLGNVSSVVRAIEIVSENDIWVAGLFTDSVNQFYPPSKNLAHWDGRNWTMLGVKIYGPGGLGDTTTQPLIGIKVFNDSSIFAISDYNSYAKWDGKRWTSAFVESKIGSLQSFWARASDDIFFVGEKGSASHWNGKEVVKMPTVLSNPPLLDVWGNESSVYAVGNPIVAEEGQQSVFLYYNGSGWAVVNQCNVVDRSAPAQNQYIGSMESVYQKNGQSTLWMLAGSDGWAVSKVKSLSPFHADEVYKIENGFYPILIRGNSDQDIFVISNLNGQFLHYNGATWKKFTPSIAMITSSFFVKGDICAMGGFLSQGHQRGIMAVCKQQ